MLNGTACRKRVICAISALSLCLALPASAQYHSADTTRDYAINLTELLRVIQFHNSEEFHCQAGTEDGYAPGPGLRTCTGHGSDYAPRDWHVNLSELLRLIQFFNARGYHAHLAGEDGFAPQGGVQEGEGEGPPEGEGQADGEAPSEGEGEGNPPIEGEDTEVIEGALDGEADLDAVRDFLFNNFFAFDDGEDVAVSLPEIVAAGYGHLAPDFAELDGNGDGQLTRFELLPVEVWEGEGASDTPPVITVLGENPITLLCGETYTDPGATAWDDEEGDLTASMLIRGQYIGARDVGEHTIRYAVGDSDCNGATATRTVYVVDNEAPVLTLLGSDSLVVECRSSLKDPGAVASDNCDLQLPTVHADRGGVNLQVPGDYSIRYYASDVSGNAAEELFRQVTVVDTTPPTITLLGSAQVLLEIGSEFVDPGATATDHCEGGAVPVLTDASAVNVLEPGAYAVVYTATDSSGNTRTKQRAVTVYDPAAPPVRLMVDMHDQGGNYCYGDCLGFDIDVSPPSIDGNVFGTGGRYITGTEITVNVAYWTYGCYLYEAPLITFYLNGTEMSPNSANTFIFSIAGDTALDMYISYYCDYYWEEEGMVEGSLEGEPEGLAEGEGSLEGLPEGEPEGAADGEGEGEGSEEGAVEGEEEFPPPNHGENPFLRTLQHPLSAFGIDVDTASYSIIRRYLRSSYSNIPWDEVRIEEMVNYFSYAYPLPQEGRPFSLYSEVSQCPWTPGHRLMRLGLQGARLPENQRPPSNVVFLMDVSGSMAGSDRLPLAKQAMTKLVWDFLDERDHLAIVTYSSSARLVLPSTQCTPSNKRTIIDVISALRASGSTHASAGLSMAYEQAAANYVPEGVNRVILTSDGDFNVGITNLPGLIAFIKEQAQTGVFLTTLGLGMGNLRDDFMQALADNGNGNYAYIDTLNEAHKILHDEVQATMITIAKDVKLQVQFNPAEVAWYRLLGYENRALGPGGFDDDEVDGGEVGAGHSVTALYELVPAGAPDKTLSGPGWKSVEPTQTWCGNHGDVAAIIDLRYKPPEGARSTIEHFMARDGGMLFEQSSPDHQFAASVAAFGMLLRGSAYSGEATYAAIQEMAEAGLMDDPYGLREEFIEIAGIANQRFGP